RPRALEAWAAVARAAGDGTGLTPRDRAEIADHEAMARGPEGLGLFERAAALYAEAGDPGEALAARARGAYIRALAGELDAALATVTSLYDAVLALYADEGTGVRQTASVAMSRARVLMRRVHEAAGVEAGADAGRVVAAAEAAAREVLALVDGRGDGDVRLAARGAEAWAMLGELAGVTGDAGRAAESFRRAAGAYVAAGLPWFAVEYDVQVAALAHQAGDLTGAERALRAALEHGAPYVEPVGRAQLHLQLAEVLGGRDAPGEAAEHALEAAHWADEAGESGTLGAWARQQLGGFLLRQGRYAEAAEVLESALADLGADTHGDGTVVQARWWLGDCLGELGEHRAAAEQRLKAADLARHWPEQQDHATLAHLAAESLGNAGLHAEAERAYARAGELWRALGNTPFLVRSLRARAWLALDGEPGTAGARALMAQAVRECETALAAAEAEADREELVAELGGTYRQFAELLARSASEETEDAAVRAASEAALERMTRAVAVFATLGAAGLHSRTGAELAAGRLEADLGRPARAAARARGVLAAYAGVDERDETARVLRAEAAQLLEAAREQLEAAREQEGEDAERD
ncbi:tetratricopeptide repeat protein, partial [Streptomyces sp. NPDC004658]